MGQRAYRGKYTDSMVRDYMNRKGNVLEEQYFFSGKPQDVKFIFDLDDPLKEVDCDNINLNRGLLNCVIPKNKKIQNLNLIIKSRILGQKISYLHSNLYCLFGTHFVKDISFINISLYNPDTDKLVNERRLIQNILDFMCFKTIKLVNINKNLMYYVIPENSEFAIVLAFREINYAERHINFLANLEDLIFHPYSKFSNTLQNYRRCLGAIDKTIPKEVTNLILPTIMINLPSLEEIEKRLELNKNKKYKQSSINQETLEKEAEEENKNDISNDNKNIKLDFETSEIPNQNKYYNSNSDSALLFEDLNDFLKEIKKREFRVISFELKIKLDNLDDYKKSILKLNKIKEQAAINKNDKENNIINNQQGELQNFSADNSTNNNKRKNSILINLDNYNNNNNRLSYIDYSDKVNTDPDFIDKFSNININPQAGENSNHFHNVGLNNIHINSNEDNLKQNKNKDLSINPGCCCMRNNTSKPIKSEEDEAIKSYSEQYLKLVKIFLKENLQILKSFQQVFISFDFDFNKKYNVNNSCSRRNEYFAYYFKKFLVKLNLENVTLIHHINFTLRNHQTQLEDEFHYLDYVFFNREIADELYKKLFLFKHSKELAKVSRKKNLMNKILSEFLFDFSNELFKEGRLDYSFQLIKNSKIVPMQINSNNTVIFMNN